MSARNRQRRRVPRPRATASQPNRLPLKPLQVPLQLPAELDPAVVQRQAAMFGYLKRVLVDGDETSACDAGTAAMLAGMVAGQRARVLMDVHGLGLEAAKAAVLAWAEEQAALFASLAATEGDGGQGARRDSEGDS